MTEYEIQDMLTNTSLASVETFGMYVTLLGAYLIASYTAGKNLTSGQAATISILFVVAAAIMAWATYGYMGRALPLANEMASIHPDREYAMQPFVRIVIAGVQILGIFASLLFLWGIRNSDKDT